MIKPEISVIICTHNPRKDYLDRVLEALRKQTLSMERWELLLIDNASKENLAESWDLSWHPSGKIIRENEVGLTAARLRGMREFNSELLVFVDDDNALFPDYLQKGLEVASEWPRLGAWGCQYIAEYESGDSYSDGSDFWSSRLDTDLWTNLKDRRAAPFGGGMFLRKKVSEIYLEKCSTEPLRKLLDRSGSSLSSFGDFDIAFTACDVGYGIGRFKTLKLIHLIPADRSTPNYLWRITKDSGYSDVIFRYLHGEQPPRRLLKRTLSFFYTVVRNLIKGDGVRLLIADELGRIKAIKFLRSFGI